MASGVFMEMNKATMSRKLNNTIDFFNVCDMNHIVEKTPTTKTIRIGDNIRLSIGVDASMDEIETYNNTT
jgi:hypothetical protein